MFKCEIAADTDYTLTARTQEKALTKDGHLNAARADMQYLPKNGSYYYATNPLTQNNPNLCMWTISGSLKINRALMQEECDAILAAHGMEPQAWEQGRLDLSSLGYTTNKSECVRKTFAHTVIPRGRRNSPDMTVPYRARSPAVTGSVRPVCAPGGARNALHAASSGIFTEGKAPTKPLCHVLDRCKQLFRNAYAAVCRSSGRATPEVEAVMAQLITPVSMRSAETGLPDKPECSWGLSGSCQNVPKGTLADTRAGRSPWNAP